MNTRIFVCIDILKRLYCSRKLNLALLEIIEKGELINLKQRWWYDKGQCGQSTAVS